MGCDGDGDAAEFSVTVCVTTPRTHRLGVLLPLWAIFGVAVMEVTQLPQTSRAPDFSRLPRLEGLGELAEFSVGQIR